MRIKVKQEYCMGCGLCQINCITAHSSFPEDIYKAFKCSKEPLFTRMVVERSRIDVFAVPCQHCDDPGCTAACLTGAMQKDSVTGLVTVEESRCIGCATCVVACPWGAIHLAPAAHIIAKCDLCKNTGHLPACVLHCPNEALVVEEG